MKWTLRKQRWVFAALPHQCIECRHIVWLERCAKATNSYGDVRFYCRECGVAMFPHKEEVN